MVKRPIAFLDPWNHCFELVREKSQWTFRLVWLELWELFNKKFWINWDVKKEKVRDHCERLSWFVEGGVVMFGQYDWLEELFILLIWNAWMNTKLYTKYVPSFYNSVQEKSRFSRERFKQLPTIVRFVLFR